MSNVTLLTGNNIDTLRSLPDGCVQCVVTSPPYYGLRDYGVDGQIGLEETPELYIEKMVQVFREVKRVLRDDGTLWLNIGDSYAGSGRGTGDYREVDGLGMTPRTQYTGMVRDNSGLKPKDLIGIPWMLAFALRADGWYLRQDIIWHKPNPMPESVTDRCTKAHEYIFLLSKSRQYFYDYGAILEPANYDGRKDTMMKGSAKYQNGFAPDGTNAQSIALVGHERWSRKVAGTGNAGDGTGLKGHSGSYSPDGEYLGHTADGIPARNKRSVWTITTQPYKEAHFATFPEKLIEPCILAGTSAKGACTICGAPWERVVEKVGGSIGKGSWTCHEKDAERGMVQNQTDAKKSSTDGSYRVNFIGWQPTCPCGREDIVPCVVLDPFNGSGTTGAVAIKHNRHYIGCELNPEYIEMTKRRLAKVQPVLMMEKL